MVLGTKAVTHSLITNPPSVLSPLAWRVPLAGLSAGQVSGTWVPLNTYSLSHAAVQIQGTVAVSSQGLLFFMVLVPEIHRTFWKYCLKLSDGLKYFWKFGCQHHAVPGAFWALRLFDDDDCPFSFMTQRTSKHLVLHPCIFLLALLFLPSCSFAKLRQLGWWLQHSGDSSLVCCFISWCFSQQSHYRHCTAISHLVQVVCAWEKHFPCLCCLLKVGGICSVVWESGGDQGFLVVYGNSHSRWL